MDFKTILVPFSHIVLWGLVLFQFAHLVIGAWYFLRNKANRYFYVFLIALYWILHGGFFIWMVTSYDSYQDAIPWVIGGLYSPTLFVLLAMTLSKTFRNFVNSIPLKWLIADVEGPARIIVGSIFILWYLAGLLPGIFTWVAGPGDIISGILAFYAIQKLTSLSKLSEVPIGELAKTKILTLKEFPLDQIRKAKNGLLIAISCILFGIFDFIAAPVSSEISILMGEVPEALGQLPLTLVPLVLVPQVLLLEVVALRQCFKVLRISNTAIIQKS